MDDRRAADEWMRVHLTERLTKIETAQGIYHSEIKDITEKLYADLQRLELAQRELHWTLFGGPEKDDIGLLEQIRALLWKAGFATLIAVSVIGGGLKFFEPELHKMALKIFGEDPVQEYIQQSQKKKIQLFNRKTGAYEYYIQFTPIGDQGQIGKKQPEEE